MEKLIITPHTRVAALLEAFPQLESLLIDIVPAFSKLRNPVLRRTIARVTTLSQAARVGNIETGRLVNLLREAVGQAFSVDEPGDEAQDSAPVPEWIDKLKVKQVIDTTVLLDQNENPLQKILNTLKEFKTGELLQVSAAFYPAPLIDTLRKKNLRCHVIADGKDHYTLFILKD